ncbi:macro domain-containing protein [Streptomyces sp. LX-29]|uniref:macro domain-containing protein n=1 Tax=Streptomyces sp. LX-29 TaxID=2900152 RepID=UPI00240D3345|nr:macro domain-containing protein [Streptomyces sp. LX-29]WFB11291.1 macro domain-containing protein [Streptomyces sp. LX-29]
MGAEIAYARGDATSPHEPGTKIIAHVCNDAGRWGAGFVMAISRRWPQPEAAYRHWHRGRADNDFALGAVQLVQTQDDLWVANMIGQHGIRRHTMAEAPVRYEAVDQALKMLSRHASVMAASIHMPRIGCGLAGGRWEKIEPLIAQRLTEQGTPVTVYDLQ